MVFTDSRTNGLAPGTIHIRIPPVSQKKTSKKKGGALLFARGTATEVLPRLMQKLGADLLLYASTQCPRRKKERNINWVDS